MSETATDPTTGELLNDLRQVMDEIDQLNKQLRPLTSRRRELEQAIISKAEAEGTDRFGNDQLSVTVQHKTTANYDPEKWDSILRWAVKTGNSHIFQRRMTDAKVEQLALDGVELPDGLSLEQIDKLNIRRK